MSPLVSIIILSWNRKDDLRSSLRQVYTADYPAYEVIVVDNNSSDGSVDMLRSEFPDTIVVALDLNIGIAGWNEGFRIAKGEFMLVLDDDSYPEMQAARRAVDYMLNHDRCGVVAFEVHNLRLNRSQTQDLLDSPYQTFVGCGALIRKSVVDIAGMFDEFLFLYAHEEEFSMRVVDAGYTVDYVPEAKAFHFSSITHRKINPGAQDCRFQYYSVRNALYILFIHFSFFKVFYRTAKFILGSVLLAMKKGCLLNTLRGLTGFVSLIIKTRFRRSPLSPSTQAAYRYGDLFGGIRGRS